jgi:hypothetical protein
VAQTGGGQGSRCDLFGLAPVAQLDRAGGFYPSGCAFKSCRGRYQVTWRTALQHGGPGQVRTATASAATGVPAKER